MLPAGKVNQKDLQMHRPVSITVISWFLIISGGIAILTLFDTDTRLFWEAMDVDYRHAVWVNLLSSVIYIGAGILMLRQNRTGRTLYVIWFPASLVLSLLVFGLSYFGFLVFTTVFYLIILYFLYRKEAGDFFEGVYEPGPVSKSTGQITRREQINRSAFARVFGLISFGIAFFILMSGLMLSEFPEIRGMRDMMYIFLGIPFILFLLGGILLWGWRRWAAGTGWVLLSAAFIVIMLGIMMHMMSGPEFSEVWGDEVEVEAIEALAQASWNALFPFFLGALLLLWQYWRDGDIFGD
jgi:hypothetical protein